jgi:hypothetical protein
MSRQRGIIAHGNVLDEMLDAIAVVPLKITAGECGIAHHVARTAMHVRAVPLADGDDVLHQTVVTAGEADIRCPAAPWPMCADELAVAHLAIFDAHEKTAVLPHINDADIAHPEVAGMSGPDRIEPVAPVGELENKILHPDVNDWVLRLNKADPLDVSLTRGEAAREATVCSGPAHSAGRPGAVQFFATMCCWRALRASGPNSLASLSPYSLRSGRSAPRIFSISVVGLPSAER